MKKQFRHLLLFITATLCCLPLTLAAQTGVTATWALDKGQESPTTAVLSQDGLTSTTGMTLGSGLKATAPQSIDNMSFYKLQPLTSNVGEPNESNAVTFSVTPKKGLTFTPTKLALKAARFGTNGGQMTITASAGGNTLTLAENVKPNRNNDNANGHFSDWSYDISGLVTTGEPVYIKVHIFGLPGNKQYGIRDVVLTGNFSGTIINVPSYTLTATTTDAAAGNITVTPTADRYDEGTSVTLTASENFGYHFAAWIDAKGKEVSTANPYTFHMSANTTLTAAYIHNNTHPLILTLTEGARKNLVSIDPEGHLIDSVPYYEEGTDVKLTAHDNPLLTFVGWEDKSTNPERLIKMDSEKQLTADFSATDYIVGWDLYNDQPGSERAADYKSDSENAGLLSLRNEAGNTTSWLTLGAQKGMQNGKYGARIWKMLADKWYFEISFSTKGYSNIKVANALGDDYNAYSTMIEQYSVDGTNYTDVGRFSLPNRGWDAQTFELPAEANDRERVYVRWIPDYTSALTGVTSDYDGTSIAEIFITADAQTVSDTTPPRLMTANPANKATGVSASGSIVLTFDKKIAVTDNAVATLGSEKLTPTVSGKTVLFKYSGLKYATNYTFNLPTGTITDRNGNAFGGITLTFTTMERHRPEPRLYDAVVAQDGTGDYTSIQAAIDNAPAGRTRPWLIFVKKGNYTGHHEIPVEKPYIHLIGQERNLVNISDSRLSGGDNAYNVAAGCTFNAKASNLYFEGINFINSWGYEKKAGPQALALYTEGDRVVLNKCGLLSYQDTWLTPTKANLRQYCKACWIEGAVDFIYGQGNIYFDRDTLNIVRRDGGYIVAPNHAPSTTWGYVFMNNVITAPGTPQETSVWLGRPWHDRPKTVFINTRAEVSIPATGWYPTMGGLPALWAEYNTMDGKGNPIDLSHRITEYYYTDTGGNRVTGQSATAVLTAQQAAEYTVKNVLGGDDGWQPELLTEPCVTPKALLEDGKLKWNAVDYAICYVISQGNEVIGFTTETSMDVAARMGDKDKKLFRVQAVNEYGALSEPAVASVTNGIGNLRETLNSPDSAKWYDLQGRHIAPPTCPGVYIRQGKKMVVR